MSADKVTISVRGREVAVPSAVVDGRTVIVTGRFMKVGVIKDEEWIDGVGIKNPRAFMAALRETQLPLDLFTFTQSFLTPEPDPEYHLEWDNYAVIPIVSFKEWWEKRLPQESRRNVRLAAKRGVVIREACFDDALVQGIVDIYNETPVRQGKSFWHYGKGFDAVKHENSSFLDRSRFIGAYLDGELIGFTKIVQVDNVGSIMQILSKNKHADKRIMNALVAKTVEVCEAAQMTHVIYRKYSYGNDTNSPLTEFKRRNGFEEVRFPRYYVAFTAKGRFCVCCGLHLGLKGVLPQSVTSVLLRWRARLHRSVRS